MLRRAAPATSTLNVEPGGYSPYRTRSAIDDVHQLRPIVVSFEIGVAIALEIRRVRRGPVDLVIPVADHMEQHTAKRITARQLRRARLLRHEAGMAVGRFDRLDLVGAARGQRQAIAIVN